MKILATVLALLISCIPALDAATYSIAPFTGWHGTVAYQYPINSLVELPSQSEEGFVTAVMNAFNQYGFQGFSEDWKNAPVTAGKTYRDIIINDPNLKDRLQAFARRVFYKDFQHQGLPNETGYFSGGISWQFASNYSPGEADKPDPENHNGLHRITVRWQDPERFNGIIEYGIKMIRQDH
jgi:hypothetical protein